jgi:hypothetical protein
MYGKARSARAECAELRPGREGPLTVVLSLWCVEQQPLDSGLGLLLDQGRLRSLWDSSVVALTGSSPLAFPAGFTGFFILAQRDSIYTTFLFTQEGRAQAMFGRLEM